MTTQVYKVLDPAQGIYVVYPTYEDCVRGIGVIAYQFYLSHVHGKPYSVVTVNEDGSETWTSTNVDEQNQMLIGEDISNVVASNIPVD